MFKNILLFILYFLPSILAISKHKKNNSAIFIVNFFLGWTLVGWMIALIWSLEDEKKIGKNTLPEKNNSHDNKNNIPTDSNSKKEIIANTARIYNKTGSFSQLLAKLITIYQPSTLEEIITFKNNFPDAPLQINKEAKEEILCEINDLKNKLTELTVEYNKKIKEREYLLIKEKGDIESKIAVYSTKQTNIVAKTYYGFKIWLFLKKKSFLNNYFDNERKRLSKILETNVALIQQNIAYKEKNIDKLVEDKANIEIDKLNAINSLLLANNKIYEGAIGEEKVVDALKKLPGSFAVINNFQKRFRKGIYQKRTNDWIYSIQIDHIVVGPTGIFIIETKNWSQSSMNNEELFSPVKQVIRASHALYCYLNTVIENGYLPSFEHHWGSLKISPNSIVVSINQPSNQEFQHVKILSLQELTQYIISRNKIFSETQVNELTKHLLTKF